MVIINWHTILPWQFLSCTTAKRQSMQQQWNWHRWWLALPPKPNDTVYMKLGWQWWKMANHFFKRRYLLEFTNSSQVWTPDTNWPYVPDVYLYLTFMLNSNKDFYYVSSRFRYKHLESVLFFCHCNLRQFVPISVKMCISNTCIFSPNEGTLRNLL